jgi:hypothetical protein
LSSLYNWKIHLLFPGIYQPLSFFLGKKYEKEEKKKRGKYERKRKKMERKWENHMKEKERKWKENGKIYV